MDAILRLAAAGIGAVRLGIDADAVVQAIPVPEAPALLPRRQGALLGVVLHEGVLVPVVDLARWVDVGTARAARLGNARILILHEGGRTLGLQVDSLDGLVEVPLAAVTRLHHDDDAEEVFHSAAAVAGSGAILSVLDVQRLATLAASWHDAVPPEALPVAAVDEAPAGSDFALLELDGVRLGIPASALAAVVPMPAPQGFGGGIAGAWCDWRGRHLPVLAAGALPGLPGAQDAPLLAVLEHEGLALGLPARSALALQAWLAPPVEDGSLTASVYDQDGNEVRLLDTAALFARFPEALLSRPEPGGAAASARAPDGGAPNDDAYIVFEAGQLVATPVAAVAHILPLAPQWTPSAAEATMPWQGEAIPLLDLRPAAQAGAAGHVLVATAGARTAAYVVNRVEVLVPAGSGRLFRLGAGSQRAVEFITVDAAEGQASYRIADLAQLASARRADELTPLIAA